VIWQVLLLSGALGVKFVCTEECRTSMHDFVHSSLAALPQQGTVKRVTISWFAEQD